MRARLYGAANPAWVGDRALDQSGRARAERQYPIEPCEVCGATEHVQRHHKDSDRLNNDRSNIAFLCPIHHVAAHRESDGRTGGGPRPRIAAMHRQEALRKARRVVELRAAGASTAQIAAAIGVHPKSIDRYLRKYPEAAA